MNLNFSNLKLVIGITYLAIISIGLYFLFSIVDIKDLMSYEFIRSNKDIILKYKNENFLFLTIIFFYIFSRLGIAFRFCDATIDIFRFCFWKMVGHINCTYIHNNRSYPVVLASRIFF